MFYLIRTKGDDPHYALIEADLLGPPYARIDLGGYSLQRHKLIIAMHEITEHYHVTPLEGYDENLAIAAWKLASGKELRDE